MAILGDISGYPILKGASGVTDLFIGGDVSNVQILTAHLLPGADSNRDLGSPTRRWQDGFFTNIHGTTLISGSSTSTGSFGRVEATKFSGDGSALTGVGSTVFPFTGNAVIKGDFIVENPSGGDDLISASIATRTVAIGDVQQNESGTKLVINDDIGKIFVPSIQTIFGIGTDSPDTTLHVNKGSAGTIASDSNAVLTVENSNHSLIQILSPEAKDGAVMFGNPTDGALDGRVVYDNADRALQFWTAGTQRVNITSGGNLEPHADDTYNLGASDKRWSDVFAVQTTTGGVFETGLKTEKIGDNPTGTIVSWREDGLVPCDSNEDELVMGVIKQGKDEPIVLGAEPVLVTGKVDVGDYIVTSDKIGHGKAVKRGYLLKKDLFGKVIAQALEPSDDSDSCLIKCMIRKM